MNKWLKKTLVILFSIVTFGMIAPPQVLLAEENHSDQASAGFLGDGQYTPKEKQQSPDINQIYREADEQAFIKFGSKIGPVIEGEFRTFILPKMEEAIAETLQTTDGTSFTVSKKPGKGKSEKIFHIYSSVTGEDLIRFHVRIDQPPKEGYWFNFHYHTYKDSYMKHHDLGSIYWNKNTPPGWMTQKEYVN
ncbi:YpjP family protein [Metabacillus sp. RGM 3146]|uniref:YpjP family protein n=1 Tax=Metabacillus sp. RGM 3146 TaxID=3401092 RepID=UPI003B9D7CE1